MTNRILKTLIDEKIKDVKKDLVKEKGDEHWPVGFDMATRLAFSTA